MFDPHQNIIDAINTLFFEPCVVEVRAPKTLKLGTVSGYFELPEHLDEMAAAVEEYSGKSNIYWTINPVHPDLLSRAFNRTKPYQINTTDDLAVTKRNWLPIDIDPQRFAGISSSDEEKATAKKVMYQVIEWLSGQGWPQPVRASSGNGYHLLYRIDLPSTGADDASTDLVQRVLVALATRFDNKAAHVDRTLYNASRILKAYGTIACKGDSTPTRPHRYAQMTVPQEPGRGVTLEQLQAVADLAPKAEQKTTGGGGWTKELVQAGLKAAEIGFRAPIAYKGGLKWQHGCFLNTDHTSPDAFTQLDKDGWVSYKCSHNSCGAGLNSREWVDMIEAKTGKIEKPIRAHKSLAEAMAKFEIDLDVQ